MSQPRRTGKGTGRPQAGPRREEFYVRVATPDGQAEFFNASASVGQVMPYSKPQATVAMKAGGDTVAFSFLQLTKRTATTIAEQPIQMPRGPLAKLERKAAQMGLDTADELVVEIAPPRPPRPRRETNGDAAVEGSAAGSAPAEDAPGAGDTNPLDDLAAAFEVDDAPAANGQGDASVGELATTVEAGPEPEAVRYRFKISRDENGLARVTWDGEEDEPVIDLPQGALRLSVYLRSPVVPRVLAVGFIGYLGKPGTPDTVARAASMVLFAMSQLVEFRILAGIETIEVPAPPGRFAAQAKQTAIRAEDRVRFSVKVFLFEEDITPVSRGDVGVEVDLRNANPSSGRLLYLFEPDAEVAPHWDRYREVFEMSISEYMRLALGNDEIAAMTYEIVLGSVDSGMIERLRDAATSVQPLDLTPTQKRPHTATPEPATPAA